MKITNTAGGPRGVETDEGTVFIEPGQTVDVEVAKGHKLYEGLEEGTVSLSSMKKADLLELAAAEEVDGVDGNSTRDDIITAIEAKRAG